MERYRVGKLFGKDLFESDFLEDNNMSDNLTGQLKSLIEKQSYGTALVGIASVDHFSNAPKGHRPEDFIPDAKSVISVAVPIVSGLMRWSDFLRDSEITRDIDTYTDDDGKEHAWSPRTVILKHVERRCGYEVINNELQSQSLWSFKKLFVIIIIRGVLLVNNAGVSALPVVRWGK